MNYNFIPFSPIASKFNLHLIAGEEKKYKCKHTSPSEYRCGTVLS